ALAEVEQARCKLLCGRRVELDQKLHRVGEPRAPHGLESLHQRSHHLYLGWSCIEDLLVNPLCVVLLPSVLEHPAEDDTGYRIASGRLAERLEAPLEDRGEVREASFVLQDAGEERGHLVVGGS